MRPKELHVFDGLRITTEHLNHLQGAMRSGLEELRRLTGAGRIHEGFTIEAQGSALVVHPGLGFDRAGNRVVSDEALGITVGPLPAGARRWVVARYRETADGAVDEKPTMAWDACAVALAEAAPTDDALVLGTLEGRADGGFVLGGAAAPVAPAADAPASASSPSAADGTAPAPEPPATVTPPAVGVTRLTGNADDATRLGRWLSAMADAAAGSAVALVPITLASVPLSGAMGVVLSTHTVTTCAIGSAKGTATAHGEAAEHGGTITQGALVHGGAGADVREGCIARVHVAPEPSATDGSADAVATLTQALALEFVVVRDTAGWRVEARLGWRDAPPSREVIAAAAAASLSVEWDGTVLWRTAGGA